MGSSNHLEVGSNIFIVQFKNGFQHSACVRCGDIDSALGNFEEMKDPEAYGVDIVAYATLLEYTFFQSQYTTY